jgi:hypothetical protein
MIDIDKEIDILMKVYPQINSLHINIDVSVFVKETLIDVNHQLSCLYFGVFNS